MPSNDDSSVQFNKKYLSTFEKLKSIINSLNETVDNSINKFTTNVDLDSEKVKIALEELIGGQNGIANIILDESGNLFSDNLLKEENSSLNCLKKIQIIIQNDNGQINKPIIIITGKKNNIKTIVILPIQFQAIGSNHSCSIIYSIDPLNGKRDLLNQTKNKIFYTYLKRGNIENGVNSLFVDGIQTSEHNNEVIKCENEFSSGWWCIYYCLNLINDGNDKFLEFSNWAKIETDLIKTILLNYIEAFETDKPIIETKIQKATNLKSLFQVDKEIEAFFHLKEKKIINNLNTLKEFSIDEQIKLVLNKKETICNEKEKVKKEIKELESIIKEGEALLTNKNTFETTDLQFKRIITGEERASLEAKALKKEEKSKESFLAYNENERRTIYEDEIKKLETSLNNEENKIKEKNTKTNDINLNVKNINEEIKTNEKNIELFNSQKNSQNTSLTRFKNDKKDLENLKSEINRYLIDSQYRELIEKILKNNSNNADKINSIKSSLETCDKNIKKYEEEILNYSKQNEKNLKEINEKKILKKLSEESLNESRETANKASSEVSYYETKVNEYDGFTGFFKYLFSKSEYNNLLSLSREWKSKYSNELNKIENLKSEIINYEKNITELNLNYTNISEKKLKCEENLKREQKTYQSYKEDLKKQRDARLDNIIEEIKSIDLKIIDTEKKIGINDIDITNSKNKITKLKEEIEHQNKELNKIKLSLELIENSKKEISDQIKKAKEKLESNQKPLVQKLQQSSRLDVLQNKFIDSVIMSDESFEQIMNLCKFKNQKWKLIYRASRDGFKGENFHNKCDDISNTLTIIKTSNGSIFGGFTSASWSKIEGFKEDPYAFLFRNKSNENVLIECSEPSNAIYCNQNCGPCFGDDDIKISNMSNLNTESESVIGFTYGESKFEYGSNESKTFLAGSKFFQTEEIEVYTKDYPLLLEIKLKEIEQFTKKDKNTIVQAYDTFHAMAVNGKIDLDSFTLYLMQKIKVFKNENEVNEMKELFEFIFKHFDEDESGELEFEEFIKCFCIFDTRNKKDIPILFFEFFFDYADKDKSQTLDVEELDQLISEFPSIFNKKNEIISLKRKLKKNSTIKKYLTKQEFLNLFRETKYDHKELEEKIIKNNFIDSNILETDKLYFDLRKLCDFEDQKWKLIYRASRDGFRAIDFHEKCDNIKNTLTIIKTNDSNIFGGFTPAPWSQKNEFESDDILVSYLFSLLNKNNKPYLIYCNNKERAIKCNKDFGPCFGDDDLVVINGSNLNKRSYLNIGQAYFNNELTIETNKEYFQSEEIEVYCKDYEPLLEDQLKEIKMNLGIDEIDAKEIYDKLNIFAINGKTSIKRFLNFMMKISPDINEKKDFHQGLLKLILDFIDKDNTGTMNFIQFLQILKILNECDPNKFFEFIFDAADQDKNNMLDLKEIKKLFNLIMPIKFNKNVIENVIEILEKKGENSSYLTKDEFIDFVKNIDFDD